MAKDVSIRLHNELDAVEKKRSRLEQENEELQVKLQDLEVAKQVLQAELEKSREVWHGPGFWDYSISLSSGYKLINEEKLVRELGEFYTRSWFSLDHRWTLRQS